MPNLTYQCYKEAHICPICGKPAEKGHVYCQYHTQKRREASSRHYYRVKEMMADDPELRERERQRHNENQRSHRAKLRAQKKCYVCGKPATHGVYCTKHWIQNVEKVSDHPFRKVFNKRPKLPIPEVSDKVHTDVGKLIALYNAGWSYRDIEDEMKISSSTIDKYVKKAKEMMRDEKSETDYR